MKKPTIKKVFSDILVQNNNHIFEDKGYEEMKKGKVIQE